MFSSALEVDMLLSCADGLPSVDDWYSTSSKAAIVVLGILAHDVLHQIVTKAFPSWHIPPNDRPQGMDGASLARLKLQRKTWRTKKFIEDTSQKEECVLLVIFGVAVEHLMLRLDHLDQQGKGLMTNIPLHSNPQTPTSSPHTPTSSPITPTSSPHHSRAACD